MAQVQRQRSPTISVILPGGYSQRSCQRARARVRRARARAWETVWKINVCVRGREGERERERASELLSSHIVYVYLVPARRKRPRPSGRTCNKYNRASEITRLTSYIILLRVTFVSSSGAIHRLLSRARDVRRRWWERRGHRDLPLASKIHSRAKDAALSFHCIIFFYTSVPHLYRPPLFEYTASSSSSLRWVLPLDFLGYTFPMRERLSLARWATRIERVSRNEFREIRFHQDYFLFV